MFSARFLWKFLYTHPIYLTVFGLYGSFYANYVILYPISNMNSSWKNKGGQKHLQLPVLRSRYHLIKSKNASKLFVEIAFFENLYFKLYVGKWFILQK